MLPLVSKTKPIESGASSLAKWTTFCSTLSSMSRKFSFSSPVTKRLSGSVTVTLIRTTVVSTRISVRGPLGPGAVGLARGSTETFGLSALRPTDKNRRHKGAKRSNRHLLRDVIGPSHSSIRVYQKRDCTFQKNGLAWMLTSPPSHCSPSESRCCHTPRSELCHGLRPSLRQLRRPRPK